MQQVSPVTAQVDSGSSVEEARGDPRHDFADPLSRQNDPQQRTADRQHKLQEQLQLSPTGTQAMAACSTGARTALMTGGPVVGAPGQPPPQGPPRLPLDPFGSVAAERSLGHQLHQLSFELKEQLHVDTKRTRTAPSCCSLCKPSQSGDGPCSAASEQTSSALPGATGGPLTPSEATQSSRPPAVEGAGDSAEAGVATASQHRSGEDCCLTCSCPCHNRRSSRSSSIVCFEGPRRPPTFAANLADLCKAFPSVHQGVGYSSLYSPIFM